MKKRFNALMFPCMECNKEDCDEREDYEKTKN